MKVNGHYLEVNPHRVQKNPKGEKYRVISLERDGTKEPEWDNDSKMMKSCWIVTIKFIDKDQRLKMYFNYQDNCIKTEKI